MDTGDILQIVYDADFGDIWFGKNGTWMVSGDPANGTSPARTGFTGIQYPASEAYGITNEMSIRTSSGTCSYTASTGFSYLDENV